ncbi:MAG: hypothetical protein U0S12_07380 [Fimbriimonadales bacterium]
MTARKRFARHRRGNALLTTFGVFTLLTVAATSFINSSTQTVRIANRQRLDVQTTHLCEAGVQSVLRSLWRPFKINQTFTDMNNRCSGSSVNAPGASLSGVIPGVGRFSAGVVAYSSPDTYARICTVRAVGYVDSNNNGSLDPGEPRKVVDVSSRFELARSQVFDYTYFVNNYGWMDGFGPSDLIVNGDMRANGNFTFTNGSPTINGSVVACANEKLVPKALGLINTPPVKMSTSTYRTNAANNPRWRQGYSSATHGAYGSTNFEKWRDFVFNSDASVVGTRTQGAVLADSNGTQAWNRQSTGVSATTTMLDQSPTDEVVMPDLSDLTYYQNLSANYVDTKAAYGDGTTNPNYGQGAYVDVWDQTLNGGSGAYKRISTNGVVVGSAALIGTSSKPIIIHGPVTFTQDCVIKGYIQGQGTIYTGRNVHLVGSLRYKNGPDFRGSDQTAIDNANEKKDMVALAARGSVIMGNPATFTDSYPLQYMTPPFTKGRYDDNGNWIPPFNAKEIDSTGTMRYKSVMGNTYLNSIAEGINQIDAVLYTNFVGGGNIGTGGGGVAFNGSIISKDEAMVVFSMPMTMNYDHRIRERNLTSTPLIDLQLPRSPVMLRSTWQDRGFSLD